jgi:hypothetical protein
MKMEWRESDEKREFEKIPKVVVSNPQATVIQSIQFNPLTQPNPLTPTYRFSFQLRPYTVKSTGSRLIPEVKRPLVRLVLWWETTWEYLML